MAEIKIACWNVNGIRSIVKKGFYDWLTREKPDILCLQETKVSPEDIPAELISPDGYHTYWNAPQKKGYAGVAVWSRGKPVEILKGFGKPEFDVEGRVLIYKHSAFTLFNIYFPNGKASPERLKFKMDFYDAFLEYVEPLRKKGQKLIICGDVNTAHNEIDIARPKENSKSSGFLPMERAWMDKFISRGYVDTFRHFHKDSVEYSYWDIKTNARARNVGWRIDYFFVTENLINRVAKSVILSDVTGSDHCPIELVINIP
ncbi:MAG TPA: exodeoxyribonuclease III [Dehalococcoidales bacterium]|nr:exodeoxyribonuclease III [Dehalococcoidales bacterium]